MSTQSTPFDLARRGRWYVRIIAATNVSVSVWTVLLYLVQIGPGRLPQQAIRIGLVIWLAYALLHAWDGARWLTAGLCVLVLVTGALQLYQMEAGPGVRLYLFGQGVLYLWIGCVLLWSPAVDAFFTGCGMVSPPVFKDGD